MSNNINRRDNTGENNGVNNNPDDQAMDEYNAMEEKWEMDNYNEIMNLDTLRDKLDMALDKETTDSLNEWLNNKRDMTVEQIAMMQLVSVLDDIQSMMHELTLDERNELIDELTHLYERYNVYAQSRMGGKQ